MLFKYLCCCSHQVAWESTTIYKIWPIPFCSGWDVFELNLSNHFIQLFSKNFKKFSNKTKICSLSSIYECLATSMDEKSKAGEKPYMPDYRAKDALQHPLYHHSPKFGSGLILLEKVCMWCKMSAFTCVVIKSQFTKVNLFNFDMIG
jgi:hypothetical protein